MLCAAVLGVAAAVVETLALGLVGLGGSMPALLAAALVTWGLARAVLPAPSTPIGVEAVSGVEAAGPVPLLALGAAGGAIAALAAWLVRHPAVGVDGILYHSTEIAAWIDSGRPGERVDLMDWIPFGSYPLTNEVALTWLSALASSFVVFAAWSAAMLALLAAATWMGARRLGAGPATAALASAVLCTLPVTVWQLNGPNTDLPALAWLVTCAALALASAGRPPLLAPAVVAAGLAVGTKTTAAPLALAVLALAAVHHRAALRPYARGLGAACAAAVAVGGVWYLRNLVDHGSPLWPFVAVPGSDPLPEAFERYGHSLLDSPRATVEARWPAYRLDLAGGLLALAGAVIAPLLARRRDVLLATAVAAASVVLWMRAPFTGLAGTIELEEAAQSTDRYLMPAIAAAVTAVVLAARSSGAGAVVARAVLVAALGWNLVRLSDVGFPVRPSSATLAGGAVLGALALLAARRLKAVPAAAALPVLVLTGAVAMAAGADGWLRRHALARQFDAALAGYFAERPGWSRGTRAVLMEPATVGPLTGDRVSRRVALVPPGADCARIAALRREAWIVLLDTLDAVPVPIRTPATTCLAGAAPTAIVPGARIYAPRAARQTATRSSASSTPEPRTSKSSTPMPAARGSTPRRARASSRS